MEAKQKARLQIGLFVSELFVFIAVSKARPEKRVASG